MLPEDDYLRLKPTAREHQAILRIALMALAGCLALLAVLVVQATAATQAPTSNHERVAPTLSKSRADEKAPVSTPPSSSLTIIIPSAQIH